MYQNILIFFKICSLLFFFLLALTAQAGFRSINYNIEVNETHLDIGLCTTDQFSTSTEIQLPILLGHSNNNLDLSIETNINGKTKILHVDYDYLTLNHTAGDKICIKYKLHNPHYPQKHLFYIEKNSFFINGLNVLASINSEQDIRVTIKFYNWQEQIISNLKYNNSQKQTFNWVGKKDDLLKSYFISGNFFLIQDKKSQINIITSKNLKKDFINKLINYLSNITVGCKNFFSTKGNSYLPPNNTFILIGEENPLFSTQGIAQRGNSFSYQVITSNDLYNNNFTNELKLSLTHEYLHQWIGLYLTGKTLQDSSWFFEGMVDYYAAKLNYVFDLYDSNSFFEFYNNVLREYYSFNFDKIEINDLPQQIPIYDLLEYRIGFLLSSIIDNKLSLASINYNLDFFIKNIINTEKFFILKDFLKKIKDSTHLDLTQLINEVLYKPDRNLLKFLPSKICIQDNTNCRKLKLIGISVPEYGFDIFTSLKYQKLTGVKLDSYAYKQGLRNKETIKAFIKYPKNDQFYLELISNSNNTKKLNVYPIYKTIKIPQYIKN
jgi:predicted metalloprotease with PDZ domain